MRGYSLRVAEMFRYRNNIMYLHIQQTNTRVRYNGMGFLPANIPAEPHSLTVYLLAAPGSTQSQGTASDILQAVVGLDYRVP